MLNKIQRRRCVIVHSNKEPLSLIKLKLFQLTFLPLVYLFPCYRVTTSSDTFSTISTSSTMCKSSTTGTSSAIASSIIGVSVRQFHIHHAHWHCLLELGAGLTISHSNTSAPISYHISSYNF